MSLEGDFLGAFEVHSPEDIRAALAAGASPTALIKGKTPIANLIEGYLRSLRFAECLRVLIDAGATVGDPLLETVLLDDDVALATALRDEGPAAMTRMLHVPSAFTSCDGVTALHICAEFNSVRCARVLIDTGANVDAPAMIDADGFGGQTPLFHAVNNIYNYSRPMMEMLVNAGANLDVRLDGVMWGPGQEWQTLILDVTPISYTQCGLFRQFHRAELEVYSNLTFLYEKRYGTALPIVNVPNRYLSRG